MGERSDAELFDQFRAGDNDALGVLAERYERPMLGMASALLRKNHAAARDAVQDAWLRVIRYAHTYKSRSTFKTWLYRLLINACADVRLKQQRHPDHLASSANRTTPTTDDALRAALDRLDWDRRVIVLLCYHRGMTHTHAAEALGIPQGTLKSRLHAALKELRNALPEEICCG